MRYDWLACMRPGILSDRMYIGLLNSERIFVTEINSLPIYGVLSHLYTCRESQTCNYHSANRVHVTAIHV